MARVNLSHVQIVILWLTVSNNSVLTWSSSINSLFSSKSITAPWLTGDLVESIANGAQMALEHCQEKFKWDRWNCPETSFSRRHRLPMTKESAFVTAITSAGIAHSVIKNCSRGDLTDCGCTRVKRSTSNIEIEIDTEKKSNEKLFQTFEDFQRTKNQKKDQISWDQCSDNVDYGEKISKSILDLEIANDAKGFAILHNNQAGRLIVKKLVQKRCRCHGVSGSCALQTCWLQSAPFREIAETLRKKYEKAIRVDFEDQNNRNSEKILDFPKEELIYLEDSPNYCKPGALTDWRGTVGRACSRTRGDAITLSEKKSCRNLCRSCGHKIKKIKKIINKRCNCQFKWCCEVKCDICQENIEEFYCD